MTDEAPTWPQLRDRLNSPPYRSATGELRWSDTTDEIHGPPEGTCRFALVLDGRVRVEDQLGPLHVQDDNWAFARRHDGPMVRHRGPAPEHQDGHPWSLIGPGDRSDKFTDQNDYHIASGSVTSTTIAGRAAWRIELTPPPHKPYPLVLAIDDETGTLLRMSGGGGDDGTFVIEMTRFDPGAPVPDEEFIWTGPYLDPPGRPPGDDDGWTGVREPRRPPPGGGRGAGASPDGEDARRPS